MTTQADVPSGKAGVSERSVLIPVQAGAAKSFRLTGTLAQLLPPKSSTPPKRGVVTIHGWGGNRTGPHRLLVRLGRALAARGIPTLRFDLSGRGESDGVAAKTSLDEMIRDTFSARGFLQEVTGCDEVDFCGICSGGNVAIGVATLTATKRVSLISVLPFRAQGWRVGLRKTLHLLNGYARKACSAETWRRLRRGEIQPGGIARTFKVGARETAVERKLKDSARDIMPALGRSGTSCQFIYGGGDPDAKSARAHYAQFCTRQSIPAKFTEVENANHNFYSTQWSEAVETAVLDFLGNSVP